MEQELLLYGSFRMNPVFVVLFNSRLCHWHLQFQRQQVGQQGLYRHYF